MLIIAVASRDFCIGRLEGWHVLPSHGTRNGSGTPARLAVVEGGRKQQRGRAGTRQHWSRPPPPVTVLPSRRATTSRGDRATAEKVELIGAVFLVA
jgi:hypothetical protein